MTGPISTAMGSGRAYKGAFGGAAGDVSRLITQLAEQAKADQQRKEDLALKQGLLGVQQSEATNRGETLKYNMSHDAATAAEATRQFGITDERTRAQTEATNALAKAREAATEQERIIDNARADAQLRESQRRGDQAGIRLGAGSYHTVEVEPGKFQDVWVPRYSGAPGAPGQSPDPSTPPAPAQSDPASAPAPDHPGFPGVGRSTIPVDATKATIQPGERGAETSTAPVDAATAAQHHQPLGSTKNLATQPELTNAANVKDLSFGWGQVKQNWDRLQHAPPSLIDNAAYLAAWSDDPKVNVIGNEVLGAKNPELQSLIQSAKTLSAQIGFTKAGKRLTNQMREVIDRWHLPRAGDTPEKLSQMFANIEQIVKDEQASVQPRALQGKNADSLWSALEAPVDYQAKMDSAKARFSQNMTGNAAQKDWDALAAKYGKDETTRQVGPRP